MHIFQECIGFFVPGASSRISRADVARLLKLIFSQNVTNLKLISGSCWTVLGKVSIMQNSLQLLSDPHKHQQSKQNGEYLNSKQNYSINPAYISSELCDVSPYLVHVLVNDPLLVHIMKFGLKSPLAALQSLHWMRHLVHC